MFTSLAIARGGLPSSFFSIGLAESHLECRAESWGLSVLVEELQSMRQGKSYLADGWIEFENIGNMTKWWANWTIDSGKYGKKYWKVWHLIRENMGKRSDNFFFPREHMGIMILKLVNNSDVMRYSLEIFGMILTRWGPQMASLVGK